MSDNNSRKFDKKKLQQNLFQKPSSNLIDQRHKKIQKKEKILSKKIKFEEYKIESSKVNFLDKLCMKQNNIQNLFIQEKKNIEVIVDLPPDDELDFAYNDTQYKFKVCGNKYIPRYLDSTCLGTKLEELIQLLNDSIHGYKLQETCKIKEIEIDFDSYEICQICGVEALKLNNIFRRKNFQKLPPKLLQYLKKDPNSDGYICEFYKCKEKGCDLLLCPYCYVFGVANKPEKKSDRELLFDMIRGTQNKNNQFYIYQ